MMQAAICVLHVAARTLHVAKLHVACLVWHVLTCTECPPTPRPVLHVYPPSPHAAVPPWIFVAAVIESPRTCCCFMRGAFQVAKNRAAVRGVC